MSKRIQSIIRCRDVPVEDIYMIIRTATDMKKRVKKEKFKKLRKILPKRTLVGHYSSYEAPWSHSAVSRATHYLGGILHQLIMEPWDPKDLHFFYDPHKFLMKRCDILLVSAKSNIFLDDFLKEKNPIPLINCGSGQNHPIRVINYLFTLRNYFGHLKDLHMGWIGPVEPLFNSFLGTVPRLYMHLKYSCCEKKPNNPIHLDLGLTLCQQSKTTIKSCYDIQEILRESQVLILSSHTEPKYLITEEKMKESKNDWVFLHNFPRTEYQISKSLMESSKNLSYIEEENLVYIWMAIIVLALTDYEPKSPPIQPPIPNEKEASVGHEQKTSSTQNEGANK